MSKIDKHFTRLMLDSIRAENADGGEGSGNFNHAGRPGQVGGSAPSEGGGGVEAAKPKKERYSVLNDNARKQMAEIKDNYYTHMSDDDRQAKTQSFIKSLEASGIKVTSNPDDWGNPHYKVSPQGLSHEEVNDIQKVLGWGVGNYTSAEDYIAECREIGQTPDLHTTPNEIHPSWLKKTDGTPVYANLSENDVLSAEDINRYENHENREKMKESAEKAAEEWTPEQATAIRNYSTEWGPGNYNVVNRYLVTGEGDERTKQAAEAVTAALDHPIGVDCTCFRGVSGNDIGQIVSDPKAAKIMAQIERGNYSKAAELKKMLEGRVVENPAVMSTSPYRDYNYGQRGIQMVLKTPADAKAVDITGASAFGGGRSKEIERFAALTGQSITRESEVAFKPGTRYRIDSVDFSLTPARKGTKEKGQIFLVCSVLTD